MYGLLVNVDKLCLSCPSTTMKKIVNCIIQCKPLNVITLGQSKSDNINRMITITELLIALIHCSFGNSKTKFNENYAGKVECVGK